jgi:hypothetical protein
MSEDNRRIIKINTESFKIPNVTRKNRKPPGEAKIKVKSPAKEQNNATLKRKLMKFIRNQHDQKIKESEKPVLNNESGEFKTEFKESLDYLSKMAKNTATAASVNTNVQNRTLKSYPTPIQLPIPLPPPQIPTFVATPSPAHKPALPPTQPSFFNPALPPPTQPSFFNPALPSPAQPSFFNPALPSPAQPSFFNPTPPPIVQQVPDYGCLKGGSLPLYKNWKNQTQKNNAVPPPIRISDLSNPASINHIKQMTDKINEIKASKPRHKKQKRTVRRTYRIGRSKVFPKVSVLVSNRTIRNNITTKTQLLKQTPIGEVKKFLIKNGFIKIGSIAPNDVLRKMYESATLICGVVTNHNPDYLLYNFMNDNDHH